MLQEFYGEALTKIKVMAKEIKLPIGIILKEPESTALSEEQKHFLLYIPWDDKYLKFVPEKYRSYFFECLPLLGVRTTNVHVAICFSFFENLISAYEKETGLTIDRDVVALAFILHDIGWSKLSEEELAMSLGYKGLVLSRDALGPKEKHATEGEKIAKEKLQLWHIGKDEQDLICACVRWHDSPEKVSLGGIMKPEIKILADLDHIWSFTKENFWQDTQRKGVVPDEYAANLDKDLESYFITDTGKEMARNLLSERKKEILLLRRGNLL